MGIFIIIYKKKVKFFVYFYVPCFYYQIHELMAMIEWYESRSSGL